MGFEVEASFDDASEPLPYTALAIYAPRPT